MLKRSPSSSDFRGHWDWRLRNKLPSWVSRFFFLTDPPVSVYSYRSLFFYFCFFGRTSSLGRYFFNNYAIIFFFLHSKNINRTFLLNNYLLRFWNDSNYIVAAKRWKRNRYTDRSDRVTDKDKWIMFFIFIYIHIISETRK